MDLGQLTDLVWSVRPIRRAFHTVSEFYWASRQRKLIERHGFYVAVPFEGLELHLDLSELHDCVLFDQMTSGKGYEPETVALVKEIVRPRSVFADIGANNGLFSILAASLVGKEGRVYAFEPGPMAFQRLTMNISRNGVSNIVTAYNVALTETNGKVPLYASDVEDGRDSLLTKSPRSAEVIARRYDDVVTQQKLDVAKIDVEGSEVAVLRGMVSHISSNPGLRLIVEWNRNYRSRELWSRLHERFTIYRIDHGNPYSLMVVRRESDLHGICNLFCTPTPLG